MSSRALAYLIDDTWKLTRSICQAFHQHSPSLEGLQLDFYSFMATHWSAKKHHDLRHVPRCMRIDHVYEKHNSSDYLLLLGHWTLSSSLWWHLFLRKLLQCISTSFQKPCSIVRFCIMLQTRSLFLHAYEAHWNIRNKEKSVVNTWQSCTHIMQAAFLSSLYHFHPCTDLL